LNIQFNNISIKNFLSFKNADIDFSNYHGYISVIGINNNPKDNAKSNGSGKSAVFDALCWVLTGETVRGVKDVKNLFVDGDAFVKLYFDLDDKQYEVTRTKGKSSTLKLIENGKDISGKGIRDTETILSDRLRDIDSTLIGSVILLGQGMPNRFSNNIPSGRKEVLEKLSKSNFMIDDLSTKISNRKTQLDNDYQNEIAESYSIKSDINSTEREILSVESQLDELESINKLKDDVVFKTQELEKCKTELNELKEKFATENNSLISLREEYVEAQIAADDKIKEDTKGLKNQAEYEQNEINSINAKILVLKKDIDRVKSIKDVCPTCGQKIQGVHKPDTSEQEKELQVLINSLANHKDSLSKLQNQIVEVENGIKDATRKLLEILANKGQSQKTIVTDIQSKINEMQDANNSLSVTIESNKNKIDLYEKNRTNLIQKLNIAKDNLKTYKEKEEQNKSNQETLVKRLDIIKKFSTVISRDFRGILLEDIIAYLNNVIVKYSNTVFGHSNLKLVLDKNNLDIIYCDKQYESLSGGEKQKVDVIIQFALRYMLCNMMNFSSNIIVLDEVFDNCDIEGCDKIIELISKELSDINSVFIITHHNFELQLSTDYDIIIIKGADNISRIS